jgi:subtilisin-like proprotein convertase family protein
MQYAAKSEDQDYVHGIGMGGVNGQGGSSGYCAIILHDNTNQQPYNHQPVFYSESARYFRLPITKVGDTSSSSMRQEVVTIKCWGAGGGSTRSSINASVTSHGGGAAFAQISVIMGREDELEISIGGSNRGGRAGIGYHGTGASGGAASVVRLNNILILVAAGGGGAGYSDYCCAHGGAGGNLTGYNGSAPRDSTPWPLTSLTHPTPITRRYDFTSSTCPSSISGDFCISQWDRLPGSLPPGHRNLQHGAYPIANYSAWSEPGLGGNQSHGGEAGSSGSFVVRTSGDATTVKSGAIAIFSQYPGITTSATAGSHLRGGDGADGMEGGGGGGGGYYGGGGGGSGIDAAGGAGGSSFVNISMSASARLSSASYNDSEGFIIHSLRLTMVDDISAMIEWKVDWQRSSVGSPYQYDIEIAYGEFSYDFHYLTSVPSFGSSLDIGSYNLTDLSPDQVYQTRIMPIFSRGRGRVSKSLTIKIPSSPVNTWEAIYPRSFSQLPSNRQGHSLTLVYDDVYMFGGRTDGITCAGSYKDSLNLGSPESGREIYPCVSQALEVQELWKFNLMTYEWLLLNDPSSNSSLPNTPPPRQQHNAIFSSDGDYYIFGGKRSSLSVDDYGNPSLTAQRDIVYGDFYKLRFDSPSNVTATWPSSPVIIPQTRRMFAAINITRYHGGVDLGDGISKTSGQCIDHLTVKVFFRHDCLQQLRFSLMGPGATTLSSSYHSPTSAYEIYLLNQRSMHRYDGCSSGDFNFAFDDIATIETDSCCLEDMRQEKTNTIRFKPEGKLASFYGASPVAQWTLVVEDLLDDSLTGELISWELDVNLTGCTPLATGTWVNLTETSAAAVSAAVYPPARYAANMMTYGRYIYLYGGRDRNDQPLDDLYRYDIYLHSWQELQPLQFDRVFSPSTFIGANYMMTSHGLLRYGGYYRLPYLSLNRKQYSNEVCLLDPVSLEWKHIVVTSSNTLTEPAGRYLSAAVIIPSKHVSSIKALSSSSLSDENGLSSSYLNYAGSSVNSMLIFGGSNGATGSIFDGTSGGLLGDSWMLRFTNWSSDRSIAVLTQARIQHCSWRLRWLAQDPSRIRCISSNSTSCTVRDLLLLSWCQGLDFSIK